MTPSSSSAGLYIHTDLWRAVLKFSTHTQRLDKSHLEAGKPLLHSACLCLTPPRTSTRQSLHEHVIKVQTFYSVTNLYLASSSDAVTSCIVTKCSRYPGGQHPQKTLEWCNGEDTCDTSYNQLVLCCECVEGTLESIKIVLGEHTCPSGLGVIRATCCIQVYTPLILGRSIFPRNNRTVPWIISFYIQQFLFFITTFNGELTEHECKVKTTD